jgi:acyl carrier protein
MEPPSQAAILQEIQRMMKELFELDSDRVQLDARLIEDLELDSLDAIDLAVKVEESTGKALDETKIRQLRTIGDVVTAISELVGSDGLGRAPTPAPATTES